MFGSRLAFPLNFNWKVTMPKEGKKGKYWSEQEVCSILEAEGYKLKSKFTTAKNKITIKCPNDHEYSAPFFLFRRGSRCPECFGNKKLTLDFIKSQFALEGYEVVSTEYKNNHSLLDYICPNKHISRIRWSHFAAGHRCKACVKNLIDPIDNTKVCTDCNIKKHVSEYYYNKHRKNKIRPQCKECSKLRANKNPRKYSEDRAELKRNYIFSHFLKNPCIDCGEADPLVLEFDHVRGTKVDSIGCMLRDGRTLDTIKAEINKCDVVCANCHRKRTYSRTNNNWRIMLGKNFGGNNKK